MTLNGKELQKRFLIALAICLITALSRFIYFEQSFGGFSYDSGSFTLAVQDYNIAEWRPHLPGYYLFVQTVKLLQFFTADIHSAMKWLIILFSALAMGALYWVLGRWFDNRISLLLVGITLTNPLVWFWGSVTEIYAFDLFYSIALVGLCYSRRGIVLSPFFLGFFSGFRPSSAALLLPLYVFFWYRYIKAFNPSVRKIAISHLIGGLGFLLWFIPMINSVGGLTNYIALYQTNNPVQNISLLQNWYRMSSFTVFMIIPFIIPVGFWFLKQMRSGNRKAKSEASMGLPADFIRVSLWWLVPPLLFFMLFHYSKGYYLLNVIPMFELILLVVRKGRYKSWLLGSSIILQILIFTAVPYSLPDIQTYISRQHRALNLAEVWWVRTKSVFLMASSQIRALDQIANEFETASKEFDQEHGIIFLDPTFPISARAMQAKYPQMKFAGFDYFAKDHYQLYSGLNTEPKTGFESMLSNAIIASRNEFVIQYLVDIRIDVCHSEGMTYYAVPAEESEKLAGRYEQLFSRLRWQPTGQ
jgi:hypothetical protein